MSRDLSAFDENGILAWAKERLGGADPSGLRSTYYSRAWRVAGPDGPLFLKASLGALRVEASICVLLRAAAGPGSCPAPTDIHDALGCFLMESLGPSTLRDIFYQHGFQARLAAAAYRKLIHIQRAADPCSLLAAGALDLRGDALAYRLEELVSRGALLALHGIDPSWTHPLVEWIHTLRGALHELSRFGLPDALGHDDFHDGNAIADADGSIRGIIDWAEISVGNPLIPLSSSLGRMSRRWALDPLGPDMALLNAAAFESFGLPEPDLAEALRLARVAQKAYDALCHARLAESSEPGFLADPRFCGRMRDILGPMIGR